MKSLLVLALVCVFAVSVNAVALDALCTKSSECTTTTDYSTCEKDYSNCAKGYCKCKDGYKKDGSSCKPRKKKGQTCAVTDICESYTTCTENECQCSIGTTYNTRLDKCITTALKAVGEGTCNVDVDCYNSLANDAVECDGSTSKCKCKTGYIQEKYECRKPHYGEACTSGIDCAPMWPEAQTEECVSDKCKCPASSSYASLTYDGVTFKMCHTDYTNRKSKDEACANHHECKSFLCAECPGESQKTCNTIPSNAVMTSPFGIMTLLSVAIMFM